MSRALRAPWTILPLSTRPPRSLLLRSKKRYTFFGKKPTLYVQVKHVNLKSSTIGYLELGYHVALTSIRFLHIPYQKAFRRQDM